MSPGHTVWDTSPWHGAYIRPQTVTFHIIKDWDRLSLNGQKVNNASLLFACLKAVSAYLQK